MLKKLIERIKKFFDYLIKRLNHYLEYDIIDWLWIAGIVLLIVICVYGIYWYETTR